MKLEEPSKKKFSTSHPSDQFGNSAEAKRIAGLGNENFGWKDD